MHQKEYGMTPCLVRVNVTHQRGMKTMTGALIVADIDETVSTIWVNACEAHNIATKNKIQNVYINPNKQ